MHGLIFETSIWLLAGSTRFTVNQHTYKPRKWEQECRQHCNHSAKQKSISNEATRSMTQWWTNGGNQGVQRRRGNAQIDSGKLIDQGSIELGIQSLQSTRQPNRANNERINSLPQFGNHGRGKPRIKWPASPIRAQGQRIDQASHCLYPKPQYPKPTNERHNLAARHSFQTSIPGGQH